MLYTKSAIFGLSFLDAKDLWLPNQFSRGSLQKRSVSIYLMWCQRRDWVASMIELILFFNPSYVCHDMNIFWSASFITFLWRCWTEFSQFGKDLRKIFRSLENIWLVTHLSGVYIGFYSNSRDWLFWMFMMSKINQLMNKSVLFWQGL